jgi:alpha-tubulin suppressor-like RCC1 family protein
MQKHLQTGDVIGTGHKIFVKGSNEYSQCTSAVSGSTKDWTHVGMKQIQATIKYITCGYYHTMVLTGTDESKLTIVDNDDLYAVGGNGDGQCGIENSKQSVKEFTLVPRGESANVRLKSIACGGYFTILLSEPGEIFGVGQVCLSN